ELLSDKPHVSETSHGRPVRFPIARSRHSWILEDDEAPSVFAFTNPQRASFSDLSSPISKSPKSPSLSQSRSGIGMGASSPNQNQRMKIDPLTGLLVRKRDDKSEEENIFKITVERDRGGEDPL